MKNNNKKSRFGGMFVLMVIVFVMFFVFSQLEINIKTYGIGVITFILIVSCEVLSANFFKYIKIEKKVKKLYWDDPDARNFQEIYENVCQKYFSEIGDLRKLLLNRTLLIIFITIAIIGGLIFIDKGEQSIWVIQVYLLLQILIVVNNVLNEKIYYEKILKEFIDVTNKAEHTIKYIGTDEKEYLKKVKEILKEDYKKIDKYQIGENSGKYITSYNLKDCIDGEISNNIHVYIGKIFCTAKRKDSGKKRMPRYSYEGSFISIDKKVNENIKILLQRNTKYDNKKNLICVNNDGFNKYYELYGDNEERTNSVMTNDLLNYVAEFKEKYEIDFEVFLQDKIYIKFYTKSLFNRGGMTEKEIDILSPGQYFLMIKFITEFMDKIDI